MEAAHTQEPRSFKNLLQGHHRRSKIDVCICKLPVSLSGSSHSASNKIDCLFSLQTGSSWVQSNISPSSQVPKFSPGEGCRPSSTKAHLQMSPPAFRRVGDAISVTPPLKCGVHALPHCSFCSVRRPELQGPLLCWPEFSSSPLAVAATGAVPGSRPWGWPSTPLSLSPVSNDSAPGGLTG